jgi:hypothetical protein
MVTSAQQGQDHGAHKPGGEYLGVGDRDIGGCRDSLGTSRKVSDNTTVSRPYKINHDINYTTILEGYSSNGKCKEDPTIVSMDYSSGPTANANANANKETGSQN